MASQHAGLAAKASDAKTTDMHLHDVINCLVGPEDSLYDKSGGDQCANLGDAVHAVSGDRASLKELKGALKKAIRGLRTDDTVRAKAYAAEARKVLVQYK